MGTTLTKLIYLGIKLRLATIEIVTNKCTRNSETSVSRKKSFMRDVNWKLLEIVNFKNFKVCRC